MTKILELSGLGTNLGHVAALKGTVAETQDVPPSPGRLVTLDESGVARGTVHEMAFPMGADCSDSVTVRELLNALMEKDRVITMLLERMATPATPQPVSTETLDGVAAFQINSANTYQASTSVMTHSQQEIRLKVSKLRSCTAGLSLSCLRS